MIEGNLTKRRLAQRSPGGSAAHAAWQRSARILGTGAALVVSLAVASPVAAQQTADSIWSGGPILTMNDQAMRAEAVAVANGKILAVGSRSEVMKLKGPETRLVDLKGRTLVPGFVDAHGHIVVGGLQALSANLLAPPDGTVQDIASLQQTLRDWVRTNAAAVEKVKVIVGFGYDNSQLKELRHPTKEELDAVSQDIPVLIVHQSGHLATVNSAMLKAMGYDSSTKDPAGGVIQRKPGTTEPNGTLEETAFFNGAPVVLGRVGPEGLKAFAREGAKLWARFGYTTAEEGRSTPQVVEMLKQVAAEGGFANDVNTYPDVLVDRAYIKANQSSSYTNRFRVAGAKLTIDGSPQGFTAWRDKPYYKPVGNYPTGYSGYAAASAEDVMGAVQWAAENDIQVITHANGERASDLLIASHQAAQARFPKAKETRPVLIHGQFLREDQIDSFKALGVITALKAMTLWPAYHHFEEATKGSLEPGKLADFAILSKDPTAVEPTTIADIKVTETVKEGKTIFRLEPGARADRSAPDITPLLAAFGGHRGRPDDGCAHDAMFQMTAVMASGVAGR